MNKVAKGTIAVAAAVVLLGGGAGSLAYWSASVNTPAMAFTTGTLKLNARTPSDAKFFLNGVETSYADLQADRFVPGEVIRWEESYDIEAYGGPGVLRIAAFDFTGSSPGLLESVQTRVTVESTYDVYQFVIQPTTEDRAYNVSGIGAAKVAIEIEWPSGDVNADLMLNEFSLAASTVTLSQVAEPLPTPTPNPT